MTTEKLKTVSPILTDCISELSKGNFVLLIDDLANQKSGYLVTPAKTITEAHICLMVNEGRSVICAALPEERVEELSLPTMSARRVRGAIDFTVSVEAREGVSTGICAADRARTLNILSTTKDPSSDIVTPGHIFPARAKKGGVLVRTSITEASIDLLKIGTDFTAAAFCHCLTKEGKIASLEELDNLSNKHKIPMLNFSEIINHQLVTQPIVKRITEAQLPTKYAGEFKAVCFVSENDNAEHLALIKGSPEEWEKNNEPPLVRVQSEQRLFDLLGLDFSERRALIMGALKEINNVGKGIFVYVRNPRQEYIQAQVRQFTSKHSTSKATQLREYGIGAQILSALGVSKAIILTRSGKSIPGISAFGVSTVDIRSFEPLNKLASIA